MQFGVYLRMFRVVDLFSGCGGLSRGMERTGRFISTFGVDIHKASVETFVRNHGVGDQRPIGHLGDICDLTMKDVWAALRQFDVHGVGELECLVGGPPCEGFSRNTVYTHKGKDDSAGIADVAAVEYAEEKYWKSAWNAGASLFDSVERKDRVVRAYNPFLNDPRNFLFREFLRIAKELMPKIILIENVAQILSHNGGEIAREIIETLEAMNYRAEARTLNAAHFGVPQKRKRAFFIAVREDVAEGIDELPWPTPSHAETSVPLYDYLVNETPLPGDMGGYVTVWEAIADLPPAKAEKDGNPSLPASEYPVVPLSQFRKFVRSSTTTPANHVYRTPSEQVIKRLKAMSPEMKAHHMPKELQTKKYYYNAYGRLGWHEPANTITKSFIYPGSGKFGHPDEDRILSYREAARLQSFDDDFTFYATSQEGISHMIGSAVPPLLGYSFGLVFAKLLDAI